MELERPGPHAGLFAKTIPASPRTSEVSASLRRPVPFACFSVSLVTVVLTWLRPVSRCRGDRDGALHYGLRLIDHGRKT
jgi:hypothetical protein